MKITIDLRSALAGLAAGVVVTLTLGATNAAPGGVGRYQVSTGDSMAFVVDTQTGQIWTARMSNAALQTDADFKTSKLK